MMFRANYALGLVLLLSAGSADARSASSDVTICDIISHRQRYLETVVRVKAVYRTTFGHGAFLEDLNCAKVAIEDLTSYDSNEQSIVDFYKNVTPDVLGPPRPTRYLVNVTGRVVSAKDLPVPLGVHRNRALLGIEFQRIWSYEQVSVQDKKGRKGDKSSKE